MSALATVDQSTHSDEKTMSCKDLQQQCTDRSRVGHAAIFDEHACWYCQVTVRKCWSSHLPWNPSNSCAKCGFTTCTRFEQRTHRIPGPVTALQMQKSSKMSNNTPSFIFYAVNQRISTLYFTTIVTRFFDEIGIFISLDTSFWALHDDANIIWIC